jgi:probable rRNA maturation factor
MNLSAKTNFSIEVYVENVYEGNLDAAVALESIPWNSWFQTWLEHLYPNIPRADAYELSLRLTCDRDIETLNYQYRQKNQPTDVLAFAALEADISQLQLENYLSEPLYLGDIVISLDTANRQAQTQGHLLTTELTWLATHGLLHLLGWDHPDEESLEQMLSQQAILLHLVGIIP